MDNNMAVCSQCGSPDVAGILFERDPPSIDFVGYIVNPSWESLGIMCKEHLGINGAAARSSGYETKIESISRGIEKK